MDGHGNLKLADLGFAKLVFEGGRAYTVCGTPDYLAPEVIEHRGATRGSDYWALGILIFEFIAGFPPFQGEPKWYQFKKICTGHIEYWPERFVQEGRDLVCALLQTDESRRLGLLSGGVRDIKAHPFYAGLDWAALSSLALTPPFKPNEHEWGQATTSPSDSKRITAELRTTMEHDPPVSVAQQEIFKGW
jgi:serine/threonine protein kinase